MFVWIKKLINKTQLYHVIYRDEKYYFYNNSYNNFYN